MLDREHLACPAKSALNFIRYEKNIVLVTDFTDLGEIACWRRNITAFSEDGLNEDGCCVGRCGLSLQQQLELEHRIHTTVLEAELSV
jgi:hypothetical protein